MSSTALPALAAFILAGECLLGGHGEVEPWRWDGGVGRAQLFLISGGLLPLRRPTFETLARAGLS